MPRNEGMRLSASLNGCILLSLVLLASVAPRTGFSQYFGENKVLYEQHDFHTYKDGRFRIYHYLPEPVVERVSDWAHDWHFRHSSVLGEELGTGAPMVIYRDHPDFQQTTAINSLIGVGTGGVTEGARERVVLPLAASHSETYHVLGHELVHAFQYSMVKSWDSTNINSLQNLPLWMVEGLAEYLSIGGRDPLTSMWLRSDLKNGELPSIRDLSKDPSRYFPYRYGHAFWALIGDEYGLRKIRPLLRKSALYGHREGIRRSLGIGADSLSSLWKERILEHFQGRLDTGKMDPPGARALKKTPKGTNELTPSLSPKGELMAFLSNRRGISMEYFVADLERGAITDRMERGMRSSHIDDLSFFSSAPAWSPQGRQIALITHSKGDHQLLIYDVQRGESVQHFKLPDLPAFRDPSWSPDGDHIALSGLKDGNSDLYVLDLQQKELEQLTEDPYSDLQPDWSPDGQHLLFASDRGPENNIDKGDMEAYSICRYDLKEERIERFGLFPGAENLEPKYGPEGQRFFFRSDRSGKRDLYSYNPSTGNLLQRSDLYTGISGLKASSQAYDIAEKTGELLIGHYRNGNYEIRHLEPEQLIEKEVQKKAIDRSLASLTPIEEKSEGSLEALMDRNASPEKGENGPYEAEFGLEYIGNASIGAGIGQMGTAMMGGISFLFSDMLKRDRLYTNLRINGNVEDIGGMVTYLNRHQRIAWNASFSHIPYRSFRSWSELAPFKGRIVERQVVELTRIYEDQLGIAAHYPISRNLRWEVGATGTRYAFRRDSINRYYDGGVLLQEDRYRDDAPDPFFTYEGRIAFVGDESKFGTTSPLEGYRFRYRLGATGGRFRYNSVLLDQRKYWFFGDIGLAFRGIHQARYGSGADGLYPLYIGYDQFLRGYAGAGYRPGPFSEQVRLGRERLIGSRTAITNMEVRVPLLGPQQLSLISSGSFYGDLVGFVDAGMAWNSGSDLALNWEPVKGIRSPLVSTGISFRINLYGMLVLEPYWAFPFQDPQKRGKFGFYLSSSGW